MAIESEPSTPHSTQTPDDACSNTDTTCLSPGRVPAVHPLPAAFPVTLPLASPVHLKVAAPSEQQRDGSLSPSVLPLEPPRRSAPRFPYSLTLALGVGLLILVVGFLAWNVPFTHLRNTIEPLGTDLRGLVMLNVDQNIRDKWETMRMLALTLRMRWDVEGQPHPVNDAQKLAQTFQPLMQYNSHLVVIVYTMRWGPCVLTASLRHVATSGWTVSRQNCTHHWLEKWDAQAVLLPGIITEMWSMGTPSSKNLDYPINQTNHSRPGLPALSAHRCPALCRGGVLLWALTLGQRASGQPFTWLPVYNPDTEMGDVFAANVAIFQNNTGGPVGRAGLGVSTAYLSRFLLEQIEGQAATVGGRMALFDSTQRVVAASHGNVSDRPPITSVGNADLEAAAQFLQASSALWCPPTSTEVTLSRRYFLDMFLISDPNPSVLRLEWCAILLSPRDNTMGPVDQSTYFAIAFVCGMTIGSTFLAVGLGLVLTRPLEQLTRGMQALKEYEFTEARQVARKGRASWFREMHSAMDSYRSLVEAMYAFGKYVPHDVVKGLLDGQVRPELAMVEEHLAVAFMDVAQFTAMCETIPAKEIVSVTRALFDRCCEAILNTRGTIDKFIGDCIMSLWGAPVSLPHPEVNALQAVLNILSMLRDQPIYLHTGRPLQLRVGLNAGHCLVGNFGASSRWEYTAIGDVVNAASRLEALNKQFGTRCLASAAVVDRVNDLAEHAWMVRHARPMGDVLLVGKAQPLSVYEVQPSPVEELDSWDDALELCRIGRLPSAIRRLEAWAGDEGAVALLQDVTGWPPTGPFVRHMLGK